MIRFFLYLCRWQLSSPILAIVMGVIKGTSMVGTKSDWICAFWANLIGGVIFFWVDKLIFAKSDGKKW